MAKQKKCYKCKHCEFKTDVKTDKYAHIRRVHVNSDKFSLCNYCEFVTEYKHHYEYHQRNHSGFKPFKCDNCDYQCVNQSMLNSHLKSHSSVYQYQCGDCQYAAKYAHSLKTHLSKYQHQPTQLLIGGYAREKAPKSTSSTSSESCNNSTTHEVANILDLRVDKKLIGN